MSMINGAEVVRLATEDALAADPSTVLLGLGVEDPKGIFGTVSGLRQRFGAHRVFETPTSEASTSGIVIGMSQNGLKPTLTHQRVEFSLLGFEQLVNQAAKWRYMTDGALRCAVTYRLIVGRGWGQGPQHSQSLESVFGHFPGLKVYAPGSLESLYQVIRWSMVDDDPCVILEHRWLHYVATVRDHIELLRVDFEGCVEPCRLLEQGDFATVVTFGVGSGEARRALRVLKQYLGVSVDLIELTTINPLDVSQIVQSLKQSGRLIVFDSGWGQYGVGSEVIAKCVINGIVFVEPPSHIHMAQTPVPSTRWLARHVYTKPSALISKLCEWRGGANEELVSEIIDKVGETADVPSEAFKGPF